MTATLSLIEKLEKLQEIEPTDPANSLQGYGPQWHNAAIRKAISIIRQHQAEQPATEESNRCGHGAGCCHMAATIDHQGFQLEARDRQIAERNHAISMMAHPDCSPKQRRVIAAPFIKSHGRESE